MDVSVTAIAKATPPPWYKIALEARAPLEWLASEVGWRWLPCPTGVSRAVIVIPGFATGDFATTTLRQYLERCGHTVYPWDLGINRGPRSQVLRRLSLRIRAIAREHGGSVDIVGWSLGGVLGRVIASRLPGHVRRVVTLGSPLGGDPDATHLRRPFEWLSGLDVNDPRLQRMVRRAAAVPLVSIYSRTDGVVAWESSHDAHPKSENVEVPSSHLGLGVNPLALYAVADRLAGARRRSGHRALNERVLASFVPALATAGRRAQ